MSILFWHHIAVTTREDFMSPQNEEVFLALTAIEEFWDTDRKIIFLGEWCKRFDRKEHWQRLDFEDAPFVWENTDVISKGIEYCNDVYERAIIAVTEVLNTYHNIEKPVHYYRIILGNWLLDFIHQLYDKYVSLRKVIALYPQAQTWRLDKEQFYVPVDLCDYHALQIWSDDYALQIYSQILTALRQFFPSRKLSSPLKQALTFDLNVTAKDKVAVLLTRLLSFFSKQIHRKTFTLTAPYFSNNVKKNYVDFLVKSKFRCVFDEMRYKATISFKIDFVYRKETKLCLNGDEFYSILSEVLIPNIPALFLEGFASFRESVKKMPIHQSKVFVTSNALFSNNIYKFFLGEHYKSLKILDSQHGAGYGIDYIHPMEEYEKSIADIFYTAGWKRGEKTSPFVIPKFYYKHKFKSKVETGILFAISEMPRYTFRLNFQPMGSFYINESLRLAVDFLKLISPQVPILVRSHPCQTLGWDSCKRVVEQCPKCRIDDFSLSFTQRLAEFSVFVSNHLGTTFLEAMAADKPTIIFLNKKIYKFHPKAEPYMENLAKRKILHWSPLSAAQHIERVINDIDSWWFSQDVIEARGEFVDQFAHSDESWQQIWIDEFNQVLSGC